MNNHRLTNELAQELSRRRAALLKEVAANQDEVAAIIAQQESEFEEAAQNDRIARLTTRLGERDRQKIREIDDALDRMSKGEYGKCAGCGRQIATQRLRALPTAMPCIKCAAARESRRRAGGNESHSERLPGREIDEFEDLSRLDSDQ